MSDTAYRQRRGEIQTYFDSTAVEAWKRFATEAPLGRIRATVRAGRARMRALMLSRLPNDLSGWRILDAGCGTGAMSVELARRGANVLGIDLAPEIIRFANETLPEDIGPGSITFAAGDMLSRNHGEFDAVVAMDSLIHYRMADSVIAVGSLAQRANRCIVFTFAPSTPLLSAMHTVGLLFPRGDRAPSIVPVRPERIRAALDGRLAGSGWHTGHTERVSSGFYKSQMMELARS
ncbi:MAG: magnesium protoporphyrin IX methyltransferase [Hyphomicrobiales bacterium]|nr:magnesium protoporphyrin IX methyltransferase [Hyphomicrobiales bacterium]